MLIAFISSEYDCLCRATEEALFMRSALLLLVEIIFVDESDLIRGVDIDHIAVQDCYVIVNNE